MNRIRIHSFVAALLIAGVPACIAAPDDGTEEALGSAEEALTFPPSSQPASLVFSQVTSLNGGGCLDAPLPRPSSGAWRLQQSQCNGGLNQNWMFSPMGSGRFRIASSQDPTSCLDLPFGATSNGTPVNIYPCNSGLNQQWKLVADASGKTTIRPAAASGVCLDVPGAVVNAHALMQVSNCNGQSNQAWGFRSWKGTSSGSCGDALLFHTSFGSQYAYPGKIASFSNNGGSLDEICLQDWSYSDPSCPGSTNFMLVNRANGAGSFNITCFGP